MGGFGFCSLWLVAMQAGSLCGCLRTQKGRLRMSGPGSRQKFPNQVGNHSRRFHFWWGRSCPNSCADLASPTLPVPFDGPCAQLCICSFQEQSKFCAAILMPTPALSAGLALNGQQANGQQARTVEEKMGLRRSKLPLTLTVVH